MNSPFEDQFARDAGEIALSALTKAPFALVITDHHLEDNPIIYVNEAFTDVTGYGREAVIGRNCRFLQGPDTDRGAIGEIRQATADGMSITKDIRNYRADGTPFWNRLMIAPMEPGDGDLRYFLGVQMALDEEDGKPPEIRSKELGDALSEIQHRVKNHLSMIVGMIRVQGRTSSAREDFEVLSHRIEALQLLYEELSDAMVGGSDEDQPVAIGSYLSRIANAIAHIDGRRGVRVNIDADALTMRFEAARQLGLLASEVLTNALQHAFEGRESGLLEMRLRALSDGSVELRIRDDGIGLPAGSDWPNDGKLGGQIVAQLVSAMNAHLKVETWDGAGTMLALTLPPRSHAA